jgi:hypothetical protein
VIESVSNRFIGKPPISLRLIKAALFIPGTAPTIPNQAHYFVAAQAVIEEQEAN